MTTTDLRAPAGPPSDAPALGADEIARLLRQHRPTDEQRAVIEAPLEPCLIVAGAGSGKTETMASRVVWLLANGLVRPDQVLGLTFTRKAAGELELRIRARLRALGVAASRSGIALPGHGEPSDLSEPRDLTDLSRPTVSTYHSYAASLVADHGLRLGLEPESRLLGEAAQFQLAAQVVEAWAGDLDLDQATSTVIDAVLSLSSALDEHLLDPAQAQERLAELVAAMEATPGKPRAKVGEAIRLLQQRGRVLDLVAAYRERKRTGAALDFGDQVALAAALARDVPQVGAAERARYGVVLLDEYQDTSFAQLELLRSLFGGGHPVMAVGDPNQSIYGWRGASAGGLARFPASFPRFDGSGRAVPASVHQLSVSWRNDHAILAVANCTADPLRAAEARVTVPQLVAGPQAGRGRVRALVVGTVEEEAAQIARFVAEQRAGGRDGSGPGGLVTAAVLCRRRSQFGVLLQALRAAGLPVEVVGLGGLLSTPEVADLVALLHAAHDPLRGDALMRLLVGAHVRLGAADVHALADWAAHSAGGHRKDRAEGVVADEAEARSLVEALDSLPRPGWRGGAGRVLSDEGRVRLVRLAGVLASVRAASWLPLPDLVAHAERLLGLDLEVAARPGADPGLARVHLDAFRDVAAQFAAGADRPGPGPFLAWLDAADAREDGLELPVTEPDPAAVQLSTVHAAKGLEWDVVAVPGLVDGTLPSLKSLKQGGPTDSGWLTGLGTLPYPLRGDRDDLPVFELAGAQDARDLEARRVAFTRAVGDHQVAEERRLAYVAFTRARHELLLTAAYWADGKGARDVSPFLTDLVDGDLVERGPDPEPPGETNPRLGVHPSVPWPADPLVVGDGRSRRPALEAAAAAVRSAVAQAAAGSATPQAAAGSDTPQAALGVFGAEAPRERGPAPDLVELLLREERDRRSGAHEVELPAHLSASALVRLDADPAAFALDLRRPVPVEQSGQARRGTRFHAWVEQWFGHASLVDVDDLPGADDEEAGSDQAALQEAFRRTGWAERTPVAVEVDLETSVEGITLRARVDAVFPDPDSSQPGAVVVVDWKTGSPPRSEAARSSRELQLAVYRLAWSRHTGTPLERVRAAFCYVADAQTVYPQRLLDEPQIADLLRRVTGRG